MNLLASKFPEQQFLVATWPETAFFVSQLPSRTGLIRGVVIIWGMAKKFAHECPSTPLLQIWGMSLTVACMRELL